MSCIIFHPSRKIKVRWNMNKLMPDAASRLFMHINCNPAIFYSTKELFYLSNLSKDLGHLGQIIPRFKFSVQKSFFCTIMNECFLSDCLLNTPHSIPFGLVFSSSPVSYYHLKKYSSRSGR